MCYIYVKAFWCDPWSLYASGKEEYDGQACYFAQDAIESPVKWNYAKVVIGDFKQYFHRSSPECRLA